MLVAQTSQARSKTRESTTLHDKILLTIPEACELLSISRSTLYALIRRRELPTVKIGARPKSGVRFRLADLQEFAEKHVI